MSTETKAVRDRIRPALCALLLAPLLGCGTIITKIDTESPNACNGRPIPPIYSGTRVSLACARGDAAPLVWAIDVPLSFTADTGVLPISFLQVGYRWLEAKMEDEPVLEPEATIAPGDQQRR
jgi:uncharacterized protein YceK